MFCLDVRDATERTVFSGRRDEAGGRLLVGTSVSEVGNCVSFEERRSPTSLTVAAGAVHFRYTDFATARRLVCL